MRTPLHYYIVRTIRPLAAVLLLCFALTTTQVAALAAPGGPVAAGSEIQIAEGFSLPSVMGSSGREQEALAPRNVPEASTTEQIFGGSFLGALLFHYPYQGMGTVDIVAFALLLFFIFRMVAAKKSQQQRPDDRFTVHRGGLQDSEEQDGESGKRSRTSVDDLRPNATGSNEDTGVGGRDNAWSRKLRGESGSGAQPARRRPATVQENAAAVWASLGSKQAEVADVQAEAVAEGAHVPAGFDVHDFLEGARALYVRLQQAWASRKVEQLEPFISSQLLQTLQKQAAANPEPSSVEILLVNATLNDVQQTGGRETAEVAFNVVMRLGETASEPEEIDEIWSFERGDDSGGMWRLHGIRQS